MKATGIIRRIDDLGRVVIPREIRLNLAITEGDPFELCYDDNGVYFRKYRPEHRLQPHLAAIRSILSDGIDDCTEDDLLSIQRLITSIQLHLNLADKKGESK